MRKLYFISVVLILFQLACNSQKQIVPAISKAVDEKSLLIIDHPTVFRQSASIDREIIIMPNGFIHTDSGVKLVFQKSVSILCDNQVFDTDVNFTFAQGTIQKLNPVWFGAKGYDNLDDTRAFQKTLLIAREYPSTINIEIPIGTFYISSTLAVENEPENKKSINLLGSGMSNSNNQGSSIIWIGDVHTTMMRFMNVNTCVIQNLDFDAGPNNLLQHNLWFQPFIHFLTIESCSFTGCAGERSFNINLNEGNGEQVSEISIRNCLFYGVRPNEYKLSSSAIKGGLANTKNFYISNCAFGNYLGAAIDLKTTEILHVEDCTFSNNDIDIACELCGTYAESNYSEHSNAFFNAGSSSNLAFTTLINNVFVGYPIGGFAIRDGSGSLVLINNNFGGTDYRDDLNRIKWEQRPFNPIFSVGNFYKNTSIQNTPFLHRNEQEKMDEVISFQDIGGKNAEGRVKVRNQK